MTTMNAKGALLYRGPKDDPSVKIATTKRS